MAKESDTYETERNVDSSRSRLFRCSIPLGGEQTGEFISCVGM